MSKHVNTPNSLVTHFFPSLPLCSLNFHSFCFYKYTHTHKEMFILNCIIVHWAYKERRHMSTPHLFCLIYTLMYIHTHKLSYIIQLNSLIQMLQNTHTHFNFLFESILCWYRMQYFFFLSPCLYLSIPFV